jgi:geranylgeranyl diphosphate synthase type 3
VSCTVAKNYSIDDIEDNSVLRRGIPTAHNIFGVASTLNSGNYVYFLALDKLINNFPPDKVAEAVNIYSQQMMELHRGQGLDIHWRDNFICPSEAEYVDMIKKKTGGLFNMGIRLLQLFSNNSADFSVLVELLGTFFQIRDDYANLLSKEVSIHDNLSVYF